MNQNSSEHLLAAESVWDYPRPPALEPCAQLLQVFQEDVLIAETRSGFRVLETSHPPVYYFPSTAVEQAYIRLGTGRSYCEWKGQAAYFDVVTPQGTVRNAGWYYPAPTKSFAAIQDHFAFYASRLSACYVDGERVTPQPGDFYGGWITSRIQGPFKGVPGSWGW